MKRVAATYPVQRDVRLITPLGLAISAAVMLAIRLISGGAPRHLEIVPVTSAVKLVVAATTGAQNRTLITVTAFRHLGSSVMSPARGGYIHRAIVSPIEHHVPGQIVDANDPVTKLCNPAPL